MSFADSVFPRCHEALRTRPFFGWIVDTAKSLFRHYCRVIVAGKCKPYFGVLKPSSPQLE
ncbi:hypothetical protein L915_19113 [Phytophthora nicotianae]|uniref:Uncharacterized protein n=1 Tax=Phytophthora nicotianae TaxID=4792 RepID=W2I248_PHYNI|nr:hypothetical protein L915_19113 [Phytophthora nicotianae]ETL27448.1 hypothetical protein L916_19009 [Phytophthora nicotianae]ETM33892.1 hypothetical protein L914_18917 [Phytophthora nicotianae]